MIQKRTPVLFTMSKSNYEYFDTDCYDINRNALTFTGNQPAIYHPPCRSWSRLKYFSRHPPEEKLLAIWSVVMARKYGGIVEHPSGSDLFKFFDIPHNSQPDKYGGFLVSINQFWFGHRAKKKTLLYFCGLQIDQLPSMPINFNAITHSVAGTAPKYKQSYNQKPITLSERSSTPIELCKYLLSCIDIIKSNQSNNYPISKI